MEELRAGEGPPYPLPADPPCRRREPVVGLLDGLLVGADVPAATVTPADDLADRLWTMQSAFGPNEAVVPQSNSFTS